MIALIHDFAAAFAYLSRTFVDTVYKKVTFFSYICLMITYPYSLLYVYPFYLIYYTVWDNEKYA